MLKEIVQKLKILFEDCSQNSNGVEFWLARDLQKLLDYDEWRNFLNVIEKAKVACANSKENVLDHFVDVNKTIPMPKGATKDIDDIMLTRYACYLIAQNGDPRKEQIAFAQSYFAIQTRKQELIEQRIALIERLNARQKLVASETELSKLIYERGVDDEGFARIRSKGDQALFGGLTTIEIKNKMNLPQNRPLADFLPTITITAKNLATEITNFNVRKDDLEGETDITKEHVKNNSDIRKLLAERGIQPENLPPEEDIKTSLIPPVYITGGNNCGGISDGAQEPQILARRMPPVLSEEPKATSRSPVVLDKLERKVRTDEKNIAASSKQIKKEV